MERYESDAQAGQNGPWTVWTLAAVHALRDEQAATERLVRRAGLAAPIFPFLMISGEEPNTVPWLQQLLETSLSDQRALLERYDTDYLPLLPSNGR